MKAATLRTFLSIHTWVGLVAGLGLFIAFYAGAVTVFTHELIEWEQTEARRVPFEAPERAQPLIDAVLKRYPQAAESFSVTLPGEHGKYATLYWYERDKSGGKIMHQFRLTADGQLDETPPRSKFVDFIYKLHYTAGLPNSWGIYVLGVISLLYGLALVSGVVIYAPVFLKDLFALRVGKNLKRMWQDAHNVVGMLSLPFHVIFAWSGAVLCIGTLLLAPFQFLVFDGKLLKILEPDFSVAPHIEAAGKPAGMLPVSELLARARVASPGMEAERLSFHDYGDANGQAEVYGPIDQKHLNNMAGVGMNAATGQLIRVVEPVNFSAGMGMLRGMQNLHFGNFGHYAVKWLYFLLGLAGAFLFYSGNLLWVEARRKRHVAEQPRRTRLMAQLTLGVCLGCMAAISALFLANKLLPAGLAERSQWEQYVYYVVFLAAVAWAFIRPPARAGHELLLACAVLTAGIPVVNAWFTGDHLLHTLWQGHWVLFGIDAVALLAAFLFWRLAVSTLRRGRQGELNSVWSLGASPAPEAQPELTEQPAR
ncbi:PepSY-associated TM helix domain-containing protein [Chitinimonas naiadis]